MGDLVRLQWYVQSEVSIVGNWGTHFTSCSSKNPHLQEFLTLQLRQRCHRCRQSYHHPNRFQEELQVLWSKSQSHCSINIPDTQSMWSLADLCNVAWFATVEAETMTRVSLHWVGVIQVHGLGTEDAAGSEG